MTCFFNKNHLKMFDFAALFKPVTEKISTNAREIVERNGGRLFQQGGNEMSLILFLLYR
jgi:hypothetical protein